MISKHPINKNRHKNQRKRRMQKNDEILIDLMVVEMDQDDKIVKDYLSLLINLMLDMRNLL